MITTLGMTAEGSGTSLPSVFRRSSSGRWSRGPHGPRLVCMMTAYTDAIMTGPGLLETDFEAQTDVCHRLGAAFTEGRSVRLTSPRGTGLRFGIEGRAANVLTNIPDPRQLAPVPSDARGRGRHGHHPHRHRHQPHPRRRDRGTHPLRPAHVGAHHLRRRPRGVVQRDREVLV